MSESKTQPQFGDLVELEATCASCGESYTAKAIQGYTGPVIGSSRTCPPCIEAKEAEEAAKLAAEEAERAERERKSREEGLLDLLHAAGANPWEHGDCTLGNYDDSESGPRPLEAINDLLAATRSAGKYDKVRGLYLFGDTGTGKTHLAVATVRELLMDQRFDPREIVFDHALSLITRIQDTYNTGASTEAILDRRINARVWILDDLGTEKASDDVVRRLTMIFTERAGRPTLVTSNDPPEKLQDRHSEYFRLQSRLGTAYFRTTKVKGRDRRFDAPAERAA